jgi:VRR-NUC domain
MTVRAHVEQTSEGQFLRAVLDFARKSGWRVSHFSDSRRQVRPGVFVGDKDAAGFPDIVAVRERVIFIELKAARGRIRPAQLEWLGALEEAGAEVYCWRPADWPEIEHTLRRRA